MWGNMWIFCGKRQEAIIHKLLISPVDRSKKAELSYEILRTKIIDGQEVSLVKIHLITGRHHQIRVQFAGHGFPLLGDAKYGKSSRRQPLALWAMELTFVHPVTGEELSLSAQPEAVRLLRHFFK